MENTVEAFRTRRRHLSHLGCSVALTGLLALSAASSASASTSSRFVLETVPVSASAGISTISTLAVASNDSGDFVTAWSDPDGVKLQAFSADGTPKGPATTVPSPNGLGLFDFDSRLAMNDNGEIAAVWTMGTPTGSTHMTWSVMLQRFDATGAPVGSTTTIRTETDPWGTNGLFYQYWYLSLGAVTMNSAGDLAVAWTVEKDYDTCLPSEISPNACNGELLSANASTSTYAAINKASGTSVGPTYIDSTPVGPVYTTVYDSALAMTIASNDSLTILFGQTSADSTKAGAFTRRYSSRLIATTGKLPLAIPSGEFIKYGYPATPPNAGFDSSGNSYLLCGYGLSDSSSHVDKFNTAGALVGSASQNPAGAFNLAVSAGGEFAVSGITYVDASSNLATVTTQAFDSNLAPIGTALTLDSGFILGGWDGQLYPLVSMNGKGNLVEITAEVTPTLDTTSLVALTVQQ